MIGIISFTPDELSQILEAVLAENGIAVKRVAVYHGSELLEFDRVDVVYEPDEPIKVFKKRSDEDDIQRLLYPPLNDRGINN